MNTDFKQPADVANRALQHVGARRIVALTDANDRASEVNFVYDKLRAAELRRNVWSFATRKVSLRPMDTDTMLVTFPVLSDNAAKFLIVSNGATPPRYYQAQVWQPTTSIDDALAGSEWTRYFGVDTAEPFDTTIIYQLGELVYSPTGVVYMSLAPNNGDDPTTGTFPAWDNTLTYRRGDTVSYLGTNYESDADLNLNNTPNVSDWTDVTTLLQQGLRIGQTWLRLDGATVTSLEFAYPLGSGPVSQPNSRNVFRLPVGFLREATQDPKAGGTSYLGAPWGLAYDDWEYENGYIISSSAGPFIYRFVCDASDVLTFDPMFAEMLACRIAIEVCERLTQSDSKLSNIASAYNKFGVEARLVNGIETGPSEPPVDDYIAARV